MKINTKDPKNNPGPSPELLDEAMTYCEYLTYNIIFLRESFSKIRPLLEKWDKSEQFIDRTLFLSETEIDETDLQFIIQEAPQALESCYKGLSKMWSVFSTINQTLYSETTAEQACFVSGTKTQWKQNNPFPKKGGNTCKTLK